MESSIAAVVLALGFFGNDFQVSAPPTVVTHAMHWGGIPGSRDPSPDKLEQVRSVIERGARPVPILAVKDDPGPPRSSRIDFDLRADAHDLRAGTESIVAMWGYERGTVRLIYGENAATGYRALWDSPLMRGNNGMGYYELTGDGVLEIIVRADLDRGGHFWTIFDTAGNELTRQQKCEEDLAGGFRDEDGVCSILGWAMEICDPNPNGSRDLLVWQSGAAMDVKFPGPQRFRLLKGRYVGDPIPKRGTRAWRQQAAVTSCSKAQQQ